jgi:hypothetical protein
MSKEGEQKRIKLDRNLTGVLNKPITRRTFIIATAILAAGCLGIPKPNKTYTPPTEQPTPEPKSDFEEFKEKYPKLAYDFNEIDYQLTKKLFEYKPELEKREDIHETLGRFVKISVITLGHLFGSDETRKAYYTVEQKIRRAKDKILDNGVIKKVVLPNIDYHVKLGDKQLGDDPFGEERESLLPMNDRELEKLVPDREDRMWVNYARGRPPAFFSMKVGPKEEYSSAQALLDNLDLMINGGKFGIYEWNTLYDRIIAVYKDPDLKSYPADWWPGPNNAAKDKTDSELVEEWWLSYEVGSDLDGPVDKHFAKYMPEFIETFRWNAKYVAPIIKKDEFMRKGWITCAGLSLLDGLWIEKMHQPSRSRYRVYAKALGYAGDEITAKNPIHPYWDECTAGVIYEELRKKLPKNVKYGPGKTVHRYVSGYDSYGNPIKMVSSLKAEVTGERYAWI